MPDNVVTIIGNVTRDPELRYTATGQGVANFGLAVSRRWQNRQTQEWEEATSFFDVVCWSGLGENVSESIQKGARVVVTGRLDQRSWEDQEGQKRTKVEIVADDVAPSLKWAKAVVTKTPSQGQQQAGNGGGAPAYAGGYQQPAAQPRVTQAQRPVISQPTFGEEDPF